MYHGLMWDIDFKLVGLIILYVLLLQWYSHYFLSLIKVVFPSKFVIPPSWQPWHNVNSSVRHGAQIMWWNPRGSYFFLSNLFLTDQVSHDAFCCCQWKWIGTLSKTTLSKTSIFTYWNEITVLVLIAF